MQQRLFTTGTTHNLRTLTETEAAYIAAFIDGEGSFTVYKSEPKNRPGLLYYGLRVSACNSHVETIEKLHVMVGAGTLIVVKRRNPKWKDVVRWTVQGDDAAALTLQIKPYLITKRAQVEVALRFAQLKHERRLSGVDNVAEQADLYHEMKRLNGRGRKHQRYQIKANLKAGPKPICQYDGCDQPHYGRGYCRTHYRWVYESKTYNPEKRQCEQCGEGLTHHRPDTKFCSAACSSKHHREKIRDDGPIRLCDVDGCGCKHHSGGLCRRHYMQRWHVEHNGGTWIPDQQRRVIRQCEGCAAILPDTATARQRFCSPNCYHRTCYEAVRRATVTGRTCAVCDTPIADTVPANRIYCSQRCNSRAFKRRRKAA